MTDDPTPTGTLTEQCERHAFVWTWPIEGGDGPVGVCSLCGRVTTAERDAKIRHAALAEAERAQYDCDAEALRRNALHQRMLAEAEQKGAREALEALTAKVRAVSKGEPETWGLVAMVHEMAEEVLRSRAARIGGGSDE